MIVVYDRLFTFDLFLNYRSKLNWKRLLSLTVRLTVGLVPLIRRASQTNLATLPLLRDCL
jgi:hypothetical protein